MFKFFIDADGFRIMCIIGVNKSVKTEDTLVIEGLVHLSITHVHIQRVDGIIIDLSRLLKIMNSLFIIIIHGLKIYARWVQRRFGVKIENKSLQIHR